MALSVFQINIISRSFCISPLDQITTFENQIVDVESEPMNCSIVEPSIQPQVAELAKHGTHSLLTDMLKRRQAIIGMFFAANYCRSRDYEWDFRGYQTVQKNQTMILLIVMINSSYHLDKNVMVPYFMDPSLCQLVLVPKSVSSISCGTRARSKIMGNYSMG